MMACYIEIAKQNGNIKYVLVEYIRETRKVIADDTSVVIVVGSVSHGSYSYRYTAVLFPGS